MEFGIIATTLSISLIMYPLVCMAHGVRGEIASGGIVVIAEYDTGEPMDYAKVDISAPNSKLPFQSGRTDRNGHFCFFPDSPGDWKVVVNDEMGHRLEVVVPVNEAKELKIDKQPSSIVNTSLSRYGKAIIGICIIFGIFGCLLGWKGYKKAKGENSKS
ncbi:MAG: hypothetical protein JRJ70_01435 [Deltaproteobacteria bacterium]|nr:hypothetical protein [Deltaproteobacteria bacterium]